MRRATPIFSIFPILLVVSLICAVPTFAESGLLPRPASISVTSKTSVLQSKNGLLVKRTSDEGTLTFNSFDDFGKFDILMLGTTGPLGTKCTGLPDTETGSVLVTGEFLIIKLTAGAAKPNGIFLKMAPFHYSCGSILSVTQGDVVANLSISGTTLKISYKQSKGEDEITSDETESGLILETSTGGGKFEESGEEDEETGGVEVGSELMN